MQPVYPSRPSVKIEGEQFITLWEKRPVWVLEIKSLDRTYCFSKRIMYACMEHFKALYEEYYDRRGNLLRSWQDFKYMIPNGVATWEACDILNYISKRHSVVKMNVSANASKVKADQFDMRWLIKMAR